ncbi:MAG: CBS domain-containing protein [Ktedonobacteraceae bacterium]|nr:CBS domain-containing protein [Ktedonobacteraceae bacterium]MBO0792564.1 CBS domain-containing protein [Ktedonobacteraceae bacterium]
MIVRNIMTTRLVTVEPDDTLAHAANLIRQHQFHHLPVARKMTLVQGEAKRVLVLEGLLTAQDIDMVAELDRQNPSQTLPWQERRVIEVMHRAAIRVTPVASVASVAQMLVQRGLNYVPVVEYLPIEEERRAVLVGLLTRSDLLMALAQAMGAFEPGMQLDIALPMGDITPLTKTLLFAAELRMPVRSIMAAPLQSGVPLVATLRLGTINPAPLLHRLREVGIGYSFGDPLVEGDAPHG